MAGRCAATPLQQGRRTNLIKCGECGQFAPPLGAYAVIRQLIAGCAISFANFAIHAVITGIIVVITRHTAGLTHHAHVFPRTTALMIVTVTALMIAHMVEIGVWGLFYSAIALDPGKGIGAFDYAFENYTALGYGDAVPAAQYRLYGPITALNGLLLIGWSVAIIFEVLRMAEVQIGRREPSIR